MTTRSASALPRTQSHQSEASAGTGWFSPAHIVLFIVLWAAAHVMSMLIWHPDVLHGGQLDPDGYMRLVRVALLRDGASWYDGGIPRSNWPFGESHHWTRPLDVLIVALTLPFRPFTDAGNALAIAGAIVAPLCHLALCVAAVWVVFPLVRGPARFYAMAAVLVQPIVFAYGKLGRADHHILIFLLFAIALGAWVRALLEPSRRRAAFAAGAVTGFGIWVGPEMLLPLALLFLSGAAAWILRGPPLAAINVRLCAGLVAALAVAIALEHPPSAWLDARFDQVSIAHLNVSMLALLFWWLAAGFRKGVRDETREGWRDRAAFALAGGLVAGGATFLVHPRFFRGPWVDVDPAVIDVWLQHVSELQPLFPADRGDAGGFIAALGAGFVALIALATWTRRETDPGRRSVWLLLLASLCVYLPLASAQLRFAPYAGIVAAVVLVELLRRALGRAEQALSGPRLVLARVAIILALLLGPSIAGRAVSAGTVTKAEGATGRAAACDLAALSGVLNDREAWGSSPRTIAAFLDFGPELLHRTNHRVLAGPYHRNRAGILAAHRLLTADDERVARGIVAERDIDLVLICPPADQDYFGAAGDGSLYNRLLQGDVPGWMPRVDLPETLAPLQLFEVVRPGRTE